MKPYIESKNISQPYREQYLKSVSNYTARLQHKAQENRQSFINPEQLSENSEKYRNLYFQMLGKPLTELDDYRKTPVLLLEKKLVMHQEDYSIFRMRLAVEGTEDGLCMYGLLFIPDKITPDMPFIISQHGGSGTPETCSDFFGDSNYNHQTYRVLERGSVVFAPQLLLWNIPNFGDGYDRFQLDSDLKQCGSSITALEVFGLMRCLDYFVNQPYCNKDHIGMIGLSYGGFYTLMTAAADVRIRSAYASCSYSDKFYRNQSDWRWNNSANTFFDAECAALIAPRAICFDEGFSDTAFDTKYTQAEFDRLKPFYLAQEVPDNCALFLFDGGHELMPTNDGVDFFFRHL